ncbi:MAG: SPFH/Band 7/PHB domain protein [Epsilonproteobacteria bacterium]|nr:SPFH/Band 7/PHB domain protein [Campylobacterota bacterium]
MDFLYGVLLVFAILVGIGIFFYTQYVVVDSETEWIVDRLGKDRVLKEGINRFIPMLDKKVAVVDMREHEIDPPKQDIITKDDVRMEIDVIASVKVIDSLKAVKSIEDYKKSVESAIMTSVFTILGNMNHEEIQKQVGSITKEIEKEIEKESIRWGIKIVQVRIENMKRPQSIIDAIEKEKAAEHEQRAAILKAEGEHKVAELHADSEKVLIEKRAAATHKVIKDLKELMPNISDEKIMEFLTKTSYIDSMSKLSSSSNSKFVLYPSEVQKPMEKIMSAEYMSQAMGK